MKVGNTGRFRIVHYIGENLTPEEVIKHKNDVKKVKIQDLTDELPDLVVADEETAKEYINYLNTKTLPEEIKEVIDEVHSGISDLNFFNYNIVKPEPEITGYEKDEYTSEISPVYGEISQNEKLWFKGYNAEIKERSKKIRESLEELKKTIL